jgi:hypothetical protein
MILARVSTSEQKPFSRIGTRLFTDGVEHDVYEDHSGRPSVIGQDGGPSRRLDRGDGDECGRLTDAVASSYALCGERELAN